MKTKILPPAFLCMIILFSLKAHAQNIFPSTGAAGIGTTSPNASSLLEIKSTTKGLLIPRMTQAQRNAITTPAKALLIYQTDGTAGFYYYNGSSWKPLSAKAWNLTGNANTDSAANFIGTTDAHPLIFKVNNLRAGYLGYGTSNTSFGYQAFSSNTSGNYNTAIGANALSSNTTGFNNTAEGSYALTSNTTGNYNIAIGSDALHNNTTANANTATGHQSLYRNTIGYSNTANGYQALYKNTEGHDNVAIGFASLFGIVYGSGNTGTGNYTLYYDTTGSNNTANGYQALYSNINGNNNTASGFASLFNNTFGNTNVANGYFALFHNTTGYSNVAIGPYALFNNKTNSNNIAIGDSALYNNDVVGNVAVGSKGLFSNSTGFNNTAFGGEALYHNTIGYDNTAFGTNALSFNNTGVANTAIGESADVIAGNLENATALGNGALVNASDKVRIGDAFVTVVESQVGSWTTSDGRFKNNIKEEVKGLEFIKLLRPVTYNFDMKKFEEFLIQNYPDSTKKIRLAKMDKNATLKASSAIQSGFVAQEVEEAIKKSGYNFNGVHVPENPTDNWSLSYEKLTVPLVKAVQELSNQNDSLKSEIGNLKSEMAELKAMIVSNQSTPVPINAGVNGLQFTVLSSALLAQNIPNPFTHNTTIGYTLPQKFANAQIVITDKNGKTLKAVTISGSGKGSLTVDASTLASGAYQYSLILDGKLIDTKQMLLAK